MNYLEQLVGEWYEYQGYFVRRNVNVGRRSTGGWECELDVVAFHPESRHVVHVEPSMDANSWDERERRYSRKFQAGKAYIPALFPGLALPQEIEQIALFGLGSNVNHPTLAGGRVMLIVELLREITRKLRPLRVEKAAVPEQYPTLRTIQFMVQHESALRGGA